MEVLISDANVLIDMEAGELVELMFQLPYEFKVSDMLFKDELSDQHGYLLELGLIETELTSEGMLEAQRLTGVYAKPSRYDCFCLALAKQEHCPLLTGDGDLRAAAGTEAVECRGTIWLVNELITHRLVDKYSARQAYERMREAGSRLPWEIAINALEA